MKHLVIEAFSPEETVFASRENLLRQNWQQVDKLIDLLPTKTLWLGFDHDAIPLSTFEKYPDNASFNTSELWNVKFREAHADLERFPTATISKQVIAFFQAWFYYGLLESFVGKKIEVSYLMRDDINKTPYLYSRNLHFCLQAKVFNIRSDPSSKLLYPYGQRT